MAIILFFVIAFSILFFRLHHRINKSGTLPPGPRGLPIIGNLHQFTNNSVQNLLQLSNQYGPLMFLRLGYLPTLVVSSAEMAKEILKTHDLDFCSRPPLHSWRKLSYDGHDLVFAPYGAYWKEMRKLCVVHLFSANKVQRTRPIREDEISRVMENILKSALASKPANLTKEMLSFTFAVMSRVAFGERSKKEEIEVSRFQRLINEGEKMAVSFFFSDHFPYMGWIDKLTGMVSRLNKTFKDLDEFYQEIIDEHLDPNRPKSEEDDMIDVLLKVRREKLFASDLTIDHIKAVLMNLFIAGTDTTAAAVIWAMTFLVKHPRVMNKAQEEVRNAIGKKGFVNEDDLQQLPYIKAVVKETFRLQPVAPLLVPKATTGKCNIKGYEIPHNTLVFVNILAIGRDPKVWENADEFFPERFIGNSIDVKGSDFELIPFGAGRRICPGMAIGLVFTELALANLLYRFDWEMPSGMKIEDLDSDTRPGIVLHKKNDLCLLPRNYV